ncbi:MAG: condensation domain-containing protein, partial [Desulfobacterales bacterium]|nr:condensation domain-containing protein [Desulfobacterales bacterium]
LSGDRGCLVLCIHHLVVDIVSWGILLEDLTQVYRALVRGDAPDLPRKTASFTAWARQMARYAKTARVREDLSYWLDEKWDRAGALPLDNPGEMDRNTEADAVRCGFSLDRGATDRLLKDIPRAHGFGARDVLLAGICREIASWTGNRSVVLDMEGHGREDIGNGMDVSRTVGWFTTLFPVCFPVDTAEDDTAAFIRHIKDRLAAVPNNGLNYGVLRYLAGQGELEKKRGPGILFNFMGQTNIAASPDAPFVMKHFEFTVGEDNAMRHFLVFDITVLEDRLHVVITYNRHLFRSGTIETLANALEDRFTRMLADLSPEAAAGRQAATPARRICKTCILPDSFPQISFDEHGICNYCRDHGTEENGGDRIHFDTEAQIIQCMEKFRDPDRRYDVLVPLSGGVDSCAAMVNIVEKYG